MAEGRGRPAGITLESAKGQTQRWQPLLPNLQRVNAAAMATGRTRFTALLHHVDVAALERAFGRQRRAASPGVDRVTMDQYEQDLAGNLQRLHARVHSGQYWPKPVLRTTSRKPMEANGPSEEGKHLLAALQVHQRRERVQKTLLGSLNRAKQTIARVEVAGVVRWQLI